MGPSPHQKVPQPPFPPLLVIVADLLFPEIIQRGPEDPVEVLMDQAAAVCGQNIVEAAAPVKAELQGTVLHAVPEGILHLRPVPVRQRTRLQTFPQDRPAALGLQKFPELAVLQRKLLLIGNRLVETSPAEFAVDAGGRCCFQRGRPHRAEHGAFSPVPSFLRDPEFHRPSGDSMFDQDLSVRQLHISSVRK